MREIRLTDQEYSSMNFILGQCTGLASKDGNDGLVNTLLRLVNTLNRDNPDFRPYETPEGLYL